MGICQPVAVPDQPMHCRPGWGRSAGVGIFVKKQLGLRLVLRCKSTTLLPGRLAAGVVDFPDMGPTLLISAYLLDGEGAGEANRRVLARAGKTLAGWAGPAIMGGDFNMTPAELKSTGILEMLGCGWEVMATGRPTCHAATH